MAGGLRLLCPISAPFFHRGREKLFAFVVTGGVVLTALPDSTRAKLTGTHDAGPFRANMRPMTKWSRVPVAEPGDVEALHRYFRESYEGAREKASS